MTLSLLTRVNHCRCLLLTNSLKIRVLHRRSPLNLPSRTRIAVKPRFQPKYYLPRLQRLKFSKLFPASKPRKRQNLRRIPRLFKFSRRNPIQIQVNSSIRILPLLVTDPPLRNQLYPLMTLVALKSMSKALWQK